MGQHLLCSLSLAKNIPWGPGPRRGSNGTIVAGGLKRTGTKCPSLRIGVRPLISGMLRAIPVLRQRHNLPKNNVKDFVFVSAKYGECASHHYRVERWWRYGKPESLGGALQCLTRDGRFSFAPRVRLLLRAMRPGPELGKRRLARGFSLPGLRISIIG